jgi:GlcNAc-P-P-Und epimerase
MKVLVTGGSGFIGVHLVDLLRNQKYTVLNLDISKPINNTNIDLWRNVSVTDKELLAKQILEFDPNYIIHLSATTTQNAISLEDFTVNIQGTQNLIEVANNLTSLKKLIFTSTQYVNTPGYPFSDDSSKLVPYGFYGESKLVGEEFIRKTFASSSWTIIRPTTIWGPWHPILSNGLWKQISKGRYFHPRHDIAVKAYGYVENTAWQIERLMQLENSFTDQQTFYLADANLAQRAWVESFVQRLTKQRMRKIPKFVLFAMSEFGEILGKAGIAFPLYRSRFRNLITSNPSPVEKTHALIGQVPIGFDAAVDRTCIWLEEEHFK